METFVKIGIAKFLLLPEKSELLKIWEAEGWGVESLPAPPARSLMGVITCFFNQTH